MLSGAQGGDGAGGCCPGRWTKSACGGDDKGGAGEQGKLTRPADGDDAGGDAGADYPADGLHGQCVGEDCGWDGDGGRGDGRSDDPEGLYRFKMS